jgi:hypothetical protein
MGIWNIVAEAHGVEFRGESEEMSCGSVAKAMPMIIVKAQAKNGGDIGIRTNGVRKKNKKSLTEGGVTVPEIKPESSRFSVSKVDHENLPKGVKPDTNTFPHRC